MFLLLIKLLNTFLINEKVMKVMKNSVTEMLKKDVLKFFVWSIIEMMFSLLSQRRKGTRKYLNDKRWS